MGCDIHLHTEVKINNEWLHYSAPWVRRNYDLFTKMAGVRSRDDEITPLSPPKGLPSDASTLTYFEATRWGIDGHSHSWLSAQEIYELFEWIKLQDWAPENWKIDDLFGYLFGNTYSGCSPIGLAAVLDIAQPDDRILLASYGSGAGSDAYSLITTSQLVDKRPRQKFTIKYQAESEFLNYIDYATYRRLKQGLRET